MNETPLNLEKTTSGVISVLLLIHEGTYVSSQNTNDFNPISLQPHLRNRKRKFERSNQFYRVQIFLIESWI